MNNYDIIIEPILSEKSTDGIAEKKYTFKVAKSATKTDVKRAVEAVFGVKVARVNTVNVNGKHVDDPPAGMDGTNWGALISILHKHGYNGMLSIEPHSSTWQGELGEKGLRFSIDYFKKLLFMD